MRWVCLGLGLFILVADALSKYWVQATLKFQAPRIVVDGFFRLNYIENDGIAFGLFHNNASAWKPALLALAAMLALGVVLYYIRSTPTRERRMFVAFGLLLGGILGNLTDRLLRGYVVDFLELHWGTSFVWPTFNIADMAITCGVGLIVLDSFLPRSEPSREAAEGETSTPVLGGHRSAILIPWLLPMAFLVQTGDAAPLSAEQALQEVQARYRSVETLRAQFRQVTTDRGIEQNESGFLVMKRPGKMYWEYQAPRSKIFVADGKKSYLYVVDQKEVLVYDLDLESSDDPLLFLMGQGSLKEGFNPAWASDEAPRFAGGRVLRLDPLRPHPEYDHLFLELDPRTFGILRLTIVEPLGNRCDYLLDDVVENQPVPDKRFRFEIPKGVRRIDH